MSKIKIFGLYLGSEIQCQQDGEVVRGVLTGIIQNDGEELEYAEIDSGGYHTAESASYCDIDEAQLILTPLSEITDEDAIEVARLNRVESSSPHIVGHAIAHWQNKNGYSRELHFEIADYLRSKSYHLPYMGQDLYELGIASKP